MVAAPHSSFFIYDGDVFYNNTPSRPGSGSAGILTGIAAVSEARMVSPGSVNLYEYNVNRPDTTTTDSLAIGLTVSGAAGVTVANYDAAVGACQSGSTPVTFVKDNNRIFPWISKDSAGSSWKTVTDSAYAAEYAQGEILSGAYSLSASIVREITTSAPYSNRNRHYRSLRNRLDFYAIRSPHYKISASLGDVSWNKDEQTLNTIAIPSIFFGSQIRPGTVSLKFYYTGSIAGELVDAQQNGELVQVSGSDSTNDGKVAGVVMYDEGYVILTGSWDINGDAGTPTWLDYAKGANDGLIANNKYSFNLSFDGHSETQVMTMFAHARRGETNFSNNPTYLKYGQEKLQYTSSHVYEENPELLVANTVSSSYNDYEAAYKRSVYISKVAVYDENKNIIGIATLSNPILKEEKDAYTFKLKIDI
tara:strand:- start:27 stop:1286 length:1260 start_codon:yes stop_codon:yes gene_type:complete